MKYTLVAILVALSILVVIPPLRYHYIYPTAGDDTASHLIYFQNMDTKDAMYNGQYLVGKFVNVLPLDPKVSFLWFHFAVMILILWSIGFSIGIAVNYLAGILAVLLVLGASYLLSLFYWGQIFDLVGIGILLPTALLCLNNITRGVGWKIGAIFALSFFSLFHANGVYVLALLPTVITYEMVRSNISGRILENRIVVYICLLSIALFIMGKTPIPLDPGRLIMDSTILAMMFIGACLGLFLRGEGRHVAILLAIMLCIPVGIEWMQNNSAVKNVDKEAIVYLNSLNGRNYNASLEVSQDIYGLFVNKKFINALGTDYIIDRSIPMTPRSDPDNMYFENQNREFSRFLYVGEYGYKLLRTFDDGEKDKKSQLPIVVQVYGK